MPLLARRAKGSRDHSVFSPRYIRESGSAKLENSRDIGFSIRIGKIPHYEAPHIFGQSCWTISQLPEIHSRLQMLMGL